ncbi:MAG: hypothetical protein ACK5B9_04520 [Flavobacteriia bacterium]|jgi:hypothetical protein
MKKAELEKRVEELTQALEGATKSMYENGLHLTEQPFIPEYLGFVHTPIENADGKVMANIYSKQGYNMSKYIDTDKLQWVVVTPDGVKVEVFLNTMYEAFFVLNGLGMQLPIKKYVAEGIL